MRRRFSQLLNLYLDGAIDQRGMADLKHLLEESVENQKEFQRQWKLQQAMKQVQRTWVLPDTSTQRVVFWRNPLGLATMAAIAALGCFFWLQSIKQTASFQEAHSLSSVELGTYAVDASDLTNNKVFFVDSALDDEPTLRPRYLGVSQSIGQGRNMMRKELLLPNNWILDPDEGLQKASVRTLPRTWDFKSNMQAYTARDEQVSKVYPFVQPANFQLP